MSRLPTFDEVAAFVSESVVLDSKHPISPETRLEADLGITGDDGEELLQEAAEHFGVPLADAVHGYRRAFGLAKDEVLFNNEPNLFGLFSWMKGEPPRRARDLTVQELHEAILRALTMGNNPGSKG